MGAGSASPDVSIQTESNVLSRVEGAVGVVDAGGIGQVRWPMVGLLVPWKLHCRDTASHLAAPPEYAYLA